ncbi:hypothetical protein QBC41DRAFT_203378, partial [Cercophora samala]
SLIYWFKTIKPVIESLGFKLLVSDFYIFINLEKDVYLILYIDNFLVLAPIVAVVNKIK